MKHPILVGDHTTFKIDKQMSAYPIPSPGKRRNVDVKQKALSNRKGLQQIF
ncbi:hypothetical protein [Mucilaginibacter panaciglaebae]|uniref:hypothetical protein n=1 Tax=Mucilaginibacter panaciglaebae TaxID=502331 RepID=UPI0031E530D6